MKKEMVSSIVLTIVMSSLIAIVRGERDVLAFVAAASNGVAVLIWAPLVYFAWRNKPEEK